MQYLIDQLGIEKDLILEFMFYFSRFEYALKREGFVNPDGDAKANWDRFFNENAALIAKLISDSKDARYIIDNPPKKQIVSNGVLGWSEREFTNEPDYNRLCICIRSIRNNLFHGGKFPGTPTEDVARNNKLVRAVLNVLIQLSGQTNQLKQHFDRKEITT